MKLCIAEKPSVARDLAEVLGAKTRKDGYFEGNGYWVTWTFGHLCSLKDPEDYNANWKYWKLEDLPIVPKNFGIKIIADNGIQKQFQTIQDLVGKCSEVINCGDAGQEGELIQRWVLLKANCKVPVKRLWISSLTDEAIKVGFSKLKDAQDFDNLFSAGNSRAIGDWMLGINGTRLFTRKFGKDKMVMSVGRVQTPTLAMIVQRQKEINGFKTEQYWELKTRYRDTEFLCQINRLTNEEKALKGLAYLQEKPFTILSFEQKEGKEGNPRLYDLTALQVDGNRRYSFSADQTLKLVQSLYEKKWVSYPRVDTTYLSEDLHPKIPQILKGLKAYTRYTEGLLSEPIPMRKTIFDNEKISDHHAIIPTGIEPTHMTADEARIYDLIVRRFIAVFYPECKVSNTTVMGQVDELTFKTTGKQVLDKGWRVVYDELDSASAKKAETEERVLPIFKEGETGPHEPFVHQGKTSPPKPYTEATLLRAMETAGKLVEDEEMRELMKVNGIGRPSTRSAIIETLFKRKYIEKKKKNLYATETGMHLIHIIKNDLLKSPELTGQWEHKLRMMEKGQYDPSQFKAELYKMVRELTDQVIFDH
ncbi:MAG: DNA topoisomerase III [Flavobacteriia bacterium]|nr:DNA topoisomerase III [Flavobacteriia bacterium]NBV67940.1 DNA topoisomerase III [Flavobacteriia bacterium]NBY40537.1 DNA topoisomerase III [Flavobacteriia bacterium]